MALVRPRHGGPCPDFSGRGNPIQLPVGIPADIAARLRELALRAVHALAVPGSVVRCPHRRWNRCALFMYGVRIQHHQVTSAGGRGAAAVAATARGPAAMPAAVPEG